MLGNHWSSQDWQCFQLTDANSIPGPCALRQFLRALCEYTQKKKKKRSQGCISTIASFSSRASISPSSSGTCTFFHSCSACSPASPESAGTAFHVTRQWIWFGNWARLKITQPGKKCFAEEKASEATVWFSQPITGAVERKSMRLWEVEREVLVMQDRDNLILRNKGRASKRIILKQDRWVI